MPLLFESHSQGCSRAAAGVAGVVVATTGAGGMAAGVGGAEGAKYHNSAARPSAAAIGIPQRKKCVWCSGMTVMVIGRTCSTVDSATRPVGRRNAKVSADKLCGTTPPRVSRPTARGNTRPSAAATELPPSPRRPATPSITELPSADWTVCAGNAGALVLPIHDATSDPIPDDLSLSRQPARPPGPPVITPTASRTSGPACAPRPNLLATSSIRP